MNLTEEEYKRLNSGLYNANSVMQHLRTRMDQLETTVSHQGATISQLRKNLEELVEDSG